MIKQFRHKKTKALYDYVGIAMDKTKSRNGESIMIYRGVDSKKLYCRNFKEFKENFIAIEKGTW